MHALMHALVVVGPALPAQQRQQALAAVAYA
jgi:predicted glycosyltransferase